MISTNNDKTFFETVVVTVAGIWLYGKILGLLKAFVYPWVFKITLILGLISPKWHRYLYMAPWEKTGKWVLDTLMYFLSPIVVFFLVFVVLCFYMIIIRMSYDEFEDGNPIGGIGLIVLVFVIAMFHVRLAWSWPPLS